MTAFNSNQISSYVSFKFFMGSQESTVMAPATTIYTA